MASPIPFRFVMASYENVRNTAFPEIGTNRHPEARTFVFADPAAQYFLSAFHINAINAQNRINALVDNLTILPAFEHNAVKTDDRVNRFQRAVLPFVDFRQNFVRDLGDQCLRDIRAVYLLQIVLYVSLAHAFGIHHAPARRPDARRAAFAQRTC